MKKKQKYKKVKKFFGINIVAVNVRGKALRFGASKAKAKFHDESGVDFSPEGASIICSKPLPSEARIQMKMLFPDKDGLNLIKANGVIKWIKQVRGKYKKYFVLGVYFRDLAREDRNKLLTLWKKYRSK
jgi:hypothetical protein